MDSIARANLSLEGLSVGDAFGERFFVPLAANLIAQRALPGGPWRYTDDTEMALGIVEVLRSHGHVDRDHLAQVFARRFQEGPHRGYGGNARELLLAIARGARWQDVASECFGGKGSMGNGGAMRVAPLGAWFAGEPSERVAAEARASAEVTHAHPEGQAGAIAVAVAAAHAWRTRAEPAPDFLGVAAAHTPDGPTREGLLRARALPPETTVETAARELGSGRRVISQDTVPFALWCAQRCPDDWAQAMWTTVAGLGDRDTTCAIAGGVLALRCGLDQIPSGWRSAREPLDVG